MIISKEEFVDIIEKLKKRQDFVHETNKKVRELNDAIIVDFFDADSLHIAHDDIVIKLLRNMFNLQDDDVLSWWIYEEDYGRTYKDGDITKADGTIIDLSTAEKLYDYIYAYAEEGVK